MCLFSSHLLSAYCVSFSLIHKLVSGAYRVQRASPGGSHPLGKRRPSRAGRYRWTQRDTTQVRPEGRRA